MISLEGAYMTAHQGMCSYYLAEAEYLGQTDRVQALIDELKRMERCQACSDFNGTDCTAPVCHPDGERI